MAEQATSFQYSTLAQQRETAMLGMWAFLATEVLFFGALVAAYFNYRIWFGAEFIAAARMTKVALGTANTAILLTSSACMASAVAANEAGSRRAAIGWLVGTAGLGLTFVAVKFFEYSLEYGERLVPALNFDSARYSGATEIFFTFYFCATGLHALHLLIGITLVTWLALRIRRRGTEHRQVARLIGLYWHFVDIVWIFLFPLIYLAGRNG
jgi:cytochrome c oxidase subunit III